ncbi:MULTISPECIES: SDR family NAD(P)-dependent oxidoreductase [Streptomyces]|uniref:SDR family NAD(P)-dependent oxidoreductase n=1 Tax=Streptomyces TaxID=1883 RepID=UPI003557F8E1
MVPGLGAAAARRFGRHGHKVGLIARTPATLTSLTEDLHQGGITDAAVPADITDTPALETALREVEAQVGAARWCCSARGPAWSGSSPCSRRSPPTSSTRWR